MIWIFLEPLDSPSLLFDLGLGFSWIPLDSLVRIGTFQWVTTDIRLEFLSEPFPSREKGKMPSAASKEKTNSTFLVPPMAAASVISKVG